MEKIVYSKFSNERDPKFNIKTDILIDERGAKFVRKSACQKEAREHILKIENYFEVLSDKFKDSKFVPNKCIKKDNCIEFEYIQANTVEDILDQCFKEKRETEIFSKIQEYTDEVKKVYSDSTFEMSKDFQKVFGDVTLPTNLKAATFMNVDMIFQNVMVEQDKWHVIDYEWTFPFLIPTNFLIYRTIFYYAYQIETRKILNENNIFLLYGLTLDEIEIYELMERNFQSYIRGLYAPISMLHTFIGKQTISLDTIEKVEEDIAKQFDLQIYFDYGNGFSHETMSSLPMRPRVDGCIEFELNLADCNTRSINENNNPISKLRIDPFTEPGLIKIQKLIAFDGRFWKKLDYTTNGVELTNDVFIFPHSDPQIIIDEEVARIQTIQLVYMIGTLHNEFTLSLSTLISKQEDVMNERLNSVQCYISEEQKLNKEIDNLRQQITLKQNEVVFWNNEYATMSRSLSWKITKPLRKITSLFKKCWIKLLKINPNLYRNYEYSKRVKVVGKLQASKEYIAKELDEDMVGIREFFQIERDVEGESKINFGNNYKFSILVPLFNTPLKYLNQMLGSVLSQSYQNWELCLADASEKEYSYVGNLCRWIAKLEPRVKYIKLDKNGGISENTNACLEIATGDYIGLLDHDDILHTSALYEYMKIIDSKQADYIYSDEDTFTEKPDDAFNPHYKPDFAPDTLRSYNYISHFSVFKKDLIDITGGFRKEFDGSQDYDLILRLTEIATKIEHVPQILYYWRAHQNSTALNISAKPYTILAAHKALKEHIERMGLEAEVEDTQVLSIYRIKYAIIGNPLISIIIPNKDHMSDLKKCIDSIFKMTTYQNYEIIIVENNSVYPETFKYYEELKDNSKVSVVYWGKEFNYSAINNFGFSNAKGEYITLLNNDVEIITSCWLEELLMFTQRSDVGATGAMLYYPDDTIQHAGIIMGIGGVAGHSHKYFKRGEYGYMGRLILAQNLSSVTAACLMTKRTVFEKLNGLDETFQVAFNDVDFCMRIRKAGYLIVFTPFAELYHYESKSRGSEDTQEKQARFAKEVQDFFTRWDCELKAGDPYYNPHFSLETEDFSIKQKQGKV